MGREQAADEAWELMSVDTEEKKLKAFWIWEFMLKNAPNKSWFDDLTNVVVFPEMPRLKQMTLVRELADQLASSKERIDVERTQKCLEALEYSFEGEPLKRNRGVHKRKLSELTHEDSVWEGLQQPVQELKEDMRKILVDDAKVKGKLSALVKKAWTLFGPTFLEKTEAAVQDGKYNPEGVPFASQNVEEGAQQAPDEEPQGNHVSGSTEGLERARQALEESRVEMEKVVKDPLPALLRKSKAAAVEEPAPRSLNEPRPSAQAHVWDEEEIPESQSPSASRRIHLPPLQSPERSLRSRRDLITSETSGGKKRRQPKKWSEVEVEILEREVAKYGKGNWKAILKNHKDVFQGRTEVDMKDKWRNIEKYGMRRTT